MGVPSIDISFTTAAQTAITRSSKGVVGLVIRDAKNLGPLRLTGASQIPTTLTAANRGYIERAFIGYQNAPRAVVVYVIALAGDIKNALNYLATQKIDYVCAPPEGATEDVAAINTWIGEQRIMHNNVKGVVPVDTNTDYLINFSTADIQVGTQVFSAAEYCSRIAGLIVGTPYTMSITYAPLPEVSDIKRLSTTEANAAVDAGFLILINDGRKIKICRGVNSLTSPVGVFSKIKIREIADMIDDDIRTTVADTFIGKFPNNYDSKLLLITAIRNYFAELEKSGILQVGSSSCDLDTASIDTYLKSVGVDTEGWTDQQLREANTGEKVFLLGTARILDAIEDVIFKIAV